MGSIPLVYGVEVHVKGCLGGGGHKGDNSPPPPPEGGHKGGDSPPPPLKVALPPPEMDYDQFYHISKSHNTGQSPYKASPTQF